MLTVTLIAIISVLAVCALPTKATTTQYTRNNDDITRITLGQPTDHSPTVSPRVYSNFLEHLGNAVNDVLWANAVFNPQFGANQRGELDRWTLENGAEWAKEGPAGHSIRLNAKASVSQSIALPAVRCREYNASLWARAQEGSPSSLKIELLHPNRGAILTSVVKAKDAQWKQYKLRLSVPDNAIGRAESPLLRITSEHATVDIANIEIFPKDAIDGVDPQVLQAAKDLHIELLRWPGGNFVSGYHWRNAIGPRVNRPTEPNPAWPGMETHHFGTDEFMKFCKHIGAKPQICINAGNGSPEEAAAWVEYCNGGKDTPMGRLRAQNGHSAPYNVRVWEIGNELYGDWQIGHTTPSGNGDRFARFSKAMLAVDPTIEILATGRGDGTTPNGVKADMAWNEDVLRSAKAVNHVPQYLSLHPLVAMPGDLRRFTYDEAYDSVMAHPIWWEQSYLPSLRKLAQSILGDDTKLMFAPTEWGLILGGNDWPKYPNHDMQSGAVYGALFMQAMMRNADCVGLSNVTALIHGGSIKRYGGRFYCDPLHYVCRMYGQARISKMVPVTVNGPGYDVPERAFLPSVTDVPWLDVVAGDAKDGARWLFVVNRSQNTTHKAEINLPVSSTVAQTITLSASPHARNGLDNPSDVLPISGSVQVAGTKFTYDFPACSVTAIRYK